MRAKDIDAHMRSVADWVDWENSTDRFTAGNPDKKIKKAAVGWKPSWENLKQAYKNGADLFISHESICVKAINGQGGYEREFALPSELPKFDWLEKTEMTVYRCHDTWDYFPEIGIRDAWQSSLELGGTICAQNRTNLITQIPPRTLGNLVQHLLERLIPLGQNGVNVSGNLNHVITKVGTGIGALTDPFAMHALGADVAIITDDYYTTVRQGEHARELGLATITVNHGVSEESAFKNLASYLSKQFPELAISHIPQNCIFRVIS